MRRRLLGRLVPACVLALALLAPACTRAPDDDAIRAEVQALTLYRGEAAMQSAKRIARHGRKALLSIESALHTADEPGRRNLIIALRRIGDADAVPLLQHLAVFDPDAGVRREAEWTLKGWAASSDGRSERARAALRRVDELRQRQDEG